MRFKKDWILLFWKFSKFAHTLENVILRQISLMFQEKSGFTFSGSDHLKKKHETRLLCCILYNELIKPITIIYTEVVVVAVVAVVNTTVWMNEWIHGIVKPVIQCYHRLQCHTEMRIQNEKCTIKRCFTTHTHIHTHTHNKQIIHKMRMKRSFWT